MIWPRQYGKSYQLRQWWVQDPANRVILTENTLYAQVCRDECRKLLAEEYPGNAERINRLLVNNRIFAWRTWLGPTLPRTGDLRQCEVAIDGLEAILSVLFKGKVKIATGAGKNEVPDFQHANGVDEFHRQMREKLGVDEDA